MKNKIIITEFVLVLAIILIANILKSDDKISITERRKLAQFPSFNKASVLSGKAFKEFEDYTVDQFIKRDSFKEIKSLFSTNVYRMQDSNKMFVKDGAIYKMEYPLKENAIQSSAGKLKNVYDAHLQGMNVYYSVIPDKTYYLHDGHLVMDYGKIEEIMAQNLPNAKYIDIKDKLEIEDFYRTDLHWKQENIAKVANYFKENLGLEKNESYELVDGEAFYGTYYGQAGTNIKPDVLNYITSAKIEEATTYNYENKQYKKVNDFEKQKSSSDKYDLFLSGPVSLLAVENKNASTDKELLLFRDSFGSSIAPYFIENYKKITLIDLRYMSSKLLKEYIEFKNQDVLFLYSGTVLNQNILK